MSLSMELEEFFKERDHLRNSRRRNRTINVNEDIHAFYKNVASHYNVGMSTIITNILIEWREEHKDEIKKELLKRIKKIDL